jgi:Flp pilus assembly protein TadB
MGHYLLHAGSVPWQDQLLYAGLILAALVALFGLLWWRKRASRPAKGDFAALATQANVADALAAQDRSPLADAAEAWEQTQQAMATVKTGIERALALVFVLLSGLGFLISLTAVLGAAFSYPNISWGSLLFWLALGAVCAWFARVQWHDFRGK